MALNTSPLSSRRQQAYLTPEEEDDLLASLGRSTLGGLAYVGSTLDKPGRAVRGVLSGLTGGEWGGGPLNLIPFSDTMGLTDSEGVTGRELLEGWGALGPNESGLDWGDVAGFGADVLLDPTTYLTLGGSALTQTGKAAKMAGELAPAVRGPLDALLTGTREAGIQAGQRGLVGVGLPFMEPAAVLGTGELAQKVARGLDFAGEALRYGDLPYTNFSPGRAAAALFDKSAKGTYSKPAQIAAQATSEAQRLAGEDALQAPLEAYRGLQGLNLTPEDQFAALSKAVEGLPSGIPELDAIAQQMRGAERSTFDALNATGRNVPELTPENMDYFSRYLSESASRPGNARIFPNAFDSGLHRSETLRDIPRSMLNDLTQGNLGVDDIVSELGLDEAAADKLNAWYGGIEGKFQGPLYGDPLRDFARYQTQGAQALEANRGVVEFLSKYANPGVQAGQESMGGVLRKFGFGGENPIADPGVAKSLERLFPGANGVPAEQLLTVLDNFGIDGALAKDATRMIQGFTQPEALAPLLNVYDTMTAAFKTGVTTPWPSFHTRNFVTGMWQNLVGGAFDPGSYSLARKLLRGEAPEEALLHPLAAGKANAQEAADFLRSELYARNVTGQSFTNEISGRFVPPSENFAGNILGEPGAEISLLGKGNPLSKGLEADTGGIVGKLKGAVAGGQQAGNYVEGLNRAAGFLALTKQGYKPTIAGAKVRALQVDFANLSDFERNVMRRLVPFYSFSKGMIPEVLKEIIERPGGLTGQAAQLSATIREGQDAFLPEYLQGGLGIPLGPEGEDGQQKFLTNLDLPVESVFEPLHAGPGWMAQTGQDILSQLNPLIKGPLELATGQQFFTGRKLADLYSPTGSVVADQLIGNSPLTRMASSARTIMDDRKSIPIKAINLLTGARVSDVDIDKQRSIASRELLEESLRGPGQTFEHLYIPEDVLPTLSPEELQQYQLYKALSSRAQKEAREKKKRIGVAR